MSAPAFPISQPGAFDLRTLIIDKVRAQDSGRSRSKQTALGPSSAGTPCDRQLWYYATQAPKLGQKSDPWPSMVGTACHEGPFTTAFQGDTDWELGRTVEIGPDLRGTYDLYHVPSATLIDMKVLGKSSLDKIKRHGAGQQYRVQTHLYGFGLYRLGVNVQHVALACFPRAGWLRDVHIWTEPFDLDVVEAALERWYTIKEASPMFTPAMFRIAPKADAPCAFCEWFNPSVAAEHPELACEGVTGAR